MTFFDTGTILVPSNKSQIKTVVIFGVERGGTSPIAGIVRGLGVYMGDNLEPNNEDPLFVHKPVSKIKQVIRMRNSTHDVWGWKFPKAAHALPLYLRNLRNPHLIIVVRDPVATALGNRKWDGPDHARHFRFALNEAAMYNAQNIGFALAANVPILLVSYERFRFNIEDAIDMIASFLDITRPEGDNRRRIIEYVSSPRYKKFEDVFNADEAVSGDHSGTNQHEGREELQAASESSPQDASREVAESAGVE